MKKLAALILKIEEVLSGLLLCLISVLVFVSAVARTEIRHSRTPESTSSIFRMSAASFFIRKTF